MLGRRHLTRRVKWGIHSSLTAGETPPNGATCAAAHVWASPLLRHPCRSCPTPLHNPAYPGPISLSRRPLLLLPGGSRGHGAVSLCVMNRLQHLHSLPPYLQNWAPRTVPSLSTLFPEPLFPVMSWLLSTSASPHSATQEM